MFHSESQVIYTTYIIDRYYITLHVATGVNVHCIELGNVWFTDVQECA